MRNENPTFRASFEAAKQRAITKAQEEIRDVQAGKKPWHRYDSHVLLYEHAFRHVLPESFQDFLARRKAQKGKVFVLDVMGTGRFSQIFPVDGEVVITLHDHRSEEQKQIDTANNRLVIAGSILEGKTWLKAYNFIKENDDTAFPGFDLVTCDALAGWRTIRGNNLSTPRHHIQLLEWIPLQRMFGSLAVGGRMAVQMLQEMYDANRLWANNLQYLSGLDTKSSGDTFRIDKITDETRILPKI